MNSKELIRINLEANMEIVLPLIEDMKDAAVVFPTKNGGCHPLWVLGHLAYSEGTIIHEFMLEEPNPLAKWKEIFGDGSEPVAEVNEYPPFDEVMQKLKETHQTTIQLLQSYSEEGLDVPSKGCPPDFQKYFGTCRQCFMAVSNHTLMHRGQVADARRAAGRKRIGP